MLILRSINYLGRPHAVLHDIGVSESPACDYVPLLLMHQTDKPVSERGCEGGGGIDKPLALSANG